MPAAHDIYVEQLRDLRRGHPLYHPEPRPEGPVEIGDVGYTKDGAFRRLFNVSRPANDPVQRFGVPDSFIQLDLGVIDAFDAVLEPGPLHSRTISTLSTEIGTPGEILPAEASFRFSCSSKRGAILMLETQMIREEAIQSRRLEAYVVQHCRSWHSFARDLDIHIGFGDLMLVTECSKTAAWSSAVYSNSSTEFGLSFSVGMPFSTGGISASNSLERIGPVERRRSQKRAHTHDQPLPKDHTVFIKAYRVGMRQMYYQSLVSLFMKARSPNLAHGPGEKEGMSGTRPQPLSPSDNSPPPAGPGGPVILRPYEPDFYPSVALLALEMEKQIDSEFVVLHDDGWCSMASESDGARIMDEYTAFYFSGEFASYLKPMHGEIFFNAESPLSYGEESLHAYYQNMGGEDVMPGGQSTVMYFNDPAQNGAWYDIPEYTFSDTALEIMRVSEHLDPPPTTGSGSVALFEPQPVLKQKRSWYSLPKSSSSHQTTLAMHPLLAYSRFNHPPISYDVTHAPASHAIVDRSTHSPIPSHMLAQPATEPPTLTTLTLTSDKLPWTVVVSSADKAHDPKNSGSGIKSAGTPITNLDVLHALHAALSTCVTQQEWEALGQGSRAQRKVTRAYESRCKAMGGGWEGGVRRVDFLGEETRLVGVQVDTAAEGGAGKLVFGKRR